MIGIRDGFVQSVIAENLNSDKIKKLCFNYGINIVEDCEDLEKVRDKRNQLAHGYLSFAEIGRDYTIEDLKKIKKSVVKHLDKVVSKIEEYINRKS